VLLAEIDSVQEQTRQLLSGTSADKSILQHQVLGKDKLGISSSVGSRGFALFSTSAHTGHHRAARALQAVKRRASVLMRKHPQELHHVQMLLQTAWRMARHSGAAVALHQRLRGQFANLFKMEHSADQVPPGSLLHSYAAGMDRVAELDRRILDITTQAKQDVGNALKDEGPSVVAEVGQMLDAAKQRETQAITAELREARDAHSEDQHFQQAMSRMTSKGLPGDTINKGTKSSKSSKEELRQAQKDIQGWQQRVAQLHQRLRDWHISDGPEERQSVGHLWEQHHRVADAIVQHLRLAKREHRLITQGESLDASLSEIRDHVADVLQDDGHAAEHAADTEVSGELQMQLTKAQKLLHDMTFFHKEVAFDVARKLSILRGKGLQTMSSSRLKRPISMLLKRRQRQQQQEQPISTRMFMQRADATLKRTQLNAAVERKIERSLLAEANAADREIQHGVHAPGTRTFSGFLRT